MRKFLILAFLFFTTTSFVMAIPVPGGKAKISSVIPQEVRSRMVSPVYYNSKNIKTPFPTNKWFNSIIWNEYGNPSLKMYVYPQVLFCEPSSFLIEKPKTVFSNPISVNPYQINYGVDYYDGRSIDEYPNILKVTAYKTFVESEYTLKDAITTTTNGVKLDKYSDWAASASWIDDSDNSKYMKATFGQGFLFTYFEFSNVYPAIEAPYNWSVYWDGSTPIFNLYDTKTGNKISNVVEFFENDSILLHVHLRNKDVYYGIFLPKGTKFFQDATSRSYASWAKIYLKLPDDKKYMSVALLPSENLAQAKEDMKKYYKYAYNFVSKTEANISVKQKNSLSYACTNFSFTFEDKRKEEKGSIFNEDVSFVKNNSFFCLFPHQYCSDNLIATSANLSNAEIETMRGNLKIYEGNKFSTENKICGIVPFFKYDISSQAKAVIKNSLNNESIKINNVYKENTYYYGKNLSKYANLIPVADNIENDTKKRLLLATLKAELSIWFTYKGQTKKYFAYDTTWGGLIGIGNPSEDSFGSEKYNDHNFHYGYYIYTAALIAMYDESFVKDYGGMVELLIKDIANTTRNDSDFPYMRNFDFYESHCWANGMGGIHNDGIDIESSSEAMNAWAAIYMWGIATQKQEYIDLGLYLYTSEYQAIKNYFFVTGSNSAVKEIFDNAGYKKTSFGILFGGVCKYDLHWVPSHKDREIKGIQLLPMTPSMLYLGYDSEYFKDFYNEMESNSDDYYWNDIWTRFLSMSDANIGYSNNAQEAWSSFSSHHDPSSSVMETDDGGTVSYTYHFIDFFRQNGSLQSGYFSNMPSYVVTKKSDGTTVYSAYNYTDNMQQVDFYKGSTYLGYMNVYAKSFMSTSALINGNNETKISVFPVPYKPNSGSRYDSSGITFLGVKDGANIKIFNIAGEKVFDKTISTDTGLFVWDAKNNYGNNVASGIYIYIVDSNGKKTKGKLAIER